MQKELNEWNGMTISMNSQKDIKKPKSLNTKRKKGEKKK